MHSRLRLPHRRVAYRRLSPTLHEVVCILADSFSRICEALALEDI